MPISDWIYGIVLIIILPVGGIFLVQGMYYGDLGLYYGEGYALAAGWTITSIIFLLVANMTAH